MLNFLLNRVKKSKYISEIVVATTTSDRDNQLVSWLQNEKINIFRGSEEDVLRRFYDCAEFFHADIIVRITADDPFKDPKVIDRAVEIFLNSNTLDYVSNTIEISYPEGIDIEVFSFQALSIANTEAKSKFQREHVTPYIIENPKKFNIKNFCFSEDLSSYRLTVDHPEDFIKALKISKHFYDNPNVEFIEIIDFLKKNPKIANINSNVKSREYLIDQNNGEIDERNEE